MSKNVNFEQNIKELENVVRQLEGGEVSLDDLLTLFEKGVGLAKSANSQLDNAEQKINMLIANKVTGELEEVPLPPNAEIIMQNAEMVPPATEVASSESEPTADDVPPPTEAPPEPSEPPMSEPDLQQAFMDIDDL